MKISALLIIVILSISTGIHAQEFLAGEYEVCFDSLKTGADANICINIILNEDSTYNLQLRNDNTFRTSVGIWKKYEGNVLLTPENNSGFYDLRNDFLDKIIPGRFLRIKGQSLIWEEGSSGKIKEREFKKLQKCNC